MEKNYSTLITFNTFQERFEYLKESGIIGQETFGHLRFLNQAFYRSPEWKRVRQKVILRDSGCDMGLLDYPITGRIYVHHMNELTEYDLTNKTKYLLDPEYLISLSYDTHTAITYGLENLLPKEIIPREKYDTCPWRR